MLALQRVPCASHRAAACASSCASRAAVSRPAAARIRASVRPARRVEEFSRVHGGRVSRRVRVSASGDRESAALDDEQCIWILEEAYADATAAAALQERMKAEPEFAARLKEAMTLEQYRERLTTAIQKSPHMQQAIEQSPMMEKMQQSVESNPLLQPFQDEKVLEQFEALQGDPRKVAMMMSQSEAKLREVAQAMVAGVEEYRADFEPDADELIDKFQEIADKGYKSFLKIALEDQRVQNAIINALMDAMEEEQANRENLGSPDASA